MAIERKTTVLLAANALLSASLIWVNLSGMAPFASSAEAGPQYRSSRGLSQPPQQEDLTGVAGATTRQRKQMIDQLKLISVKLDGLDKSLQSGNVAVRVENLNEIELGIDYDRLARAIKNGSK